MIYLQSSLQRIIWLTLCVWLLYRVILDRLNLCQTIPLYFTLNAATGGLHNCCSKQWAEVCGVCGVCGEVGVSVCLCVVRGKWICAQMRCQKANLPSRKQVHNITSSTCSVFGRFQIKIRVTHWCRCLLERRWEQPAAIRGLLWGCWKTIKSTSREEQSKVERS